MQCKLQSLSKWKKKKRINGKGFCGLDDPNSITYNLHLFIPLIKAEEEQLPDSTAAAGYSWICQRPFGNMYGNDPQFMTLYSRRNKLPVYSIHKADITWTNDGKRATALPRGGAFETAAQLSTTFWHTELPNDQSFSNSRFDRGHLFADNYASDKAQQKATYRITNVVAQDPDFNEKQWRKAESWLMKEGMFKCKHPDGDITKTVGSSYVLTGAVIGRQAENGEPGFQDGLYRIRYGQDEEMQVPTHVDHNAM